MSITAKPRCFFKVFLPQRSSERLHIPNAFVALTRLKERVPEEFILRNGRGRDWKVKTSCIGDRVFFDDGWKKFVKENALQAADFVVVRYNGSNTMKFKIYELSTSCEKTDIKEEVEHEKEDDGLRETEIEVGEEMETSDEEEEEEEEEDDNYVMEEVEDDDDDDDNGVDDDDDDDYDEEEEEENTVMDHHVALDISKRDTAGSSSSKGNDLNKYGAIVANFDHPDNPYFVAKQLKTRTNEVHIPYKIIKDYSLSLPETITICCQDIDVTSPEQKTIRKSRWTDTGKVHTWKDGRVCIRGWATFCGKNKIKASDTCICELLLGEDLKKVKMLQVHVVRKQV